MTSLYIGTVAALLLALPACAATNPVDEVECGQSPVFAQEMELDIFYRGSTHTHAERSYDSTAPIPDVMQWFKNAGYHFVVLTDHNVSGVPGEFSAMESAEFIVIAGEEVSSRGAVTDEIIKPVHVSSICSNGSTVGGVDLDGIANTLRVTVQNVVNSAGALVQVNHPNYRYALTAEDIVSAPHARLLEIANQAESMNNSGDQNNPSTEEIWDALLGFGMEIYAVASDDSHDLAIDSPAPPGQGWVQVAADELKDEAICAALSEGWFYASIGAELSRINVGRSSMHVDIVAAPGETGDDYSTDFIGRDGLILQTSRGLSATYHLKEAQLYVRAKVMGPDDKTAWTQPAFVTTSSCDVPRTNTGPVKIRWQEGDD